MSNKQLMVRETIEIIMTQKGATQEEIVSKVFKEIHAQIYKQVGKPIIQVETEAVYFDDIKEVIEKKGVLKKEKENLEITVRVLLLVRYLDI